MLRIDIVTIFPKMFDAVLSESIIKRAQEKSLVEIRVHDLRKWTFDKHKTVDDKPFGGGPGMVMMLEPVYRALKELNGANKKVILMSAKGECYSQRQAEVLAKQNDLILLCPHYEGIDHRVVEHLVDQSVSIGSYVLTGGEIPAMVVVDSVVRLVPGVLGKDESVEMESHSEVKLNDQPVEVLEYPQYTRPAKFEGGEGEVWEVPEILLSGDHEKIKQWRIGNLKVSKCPIQAMETF